MAKARGSRAGKKRKVVKKSKPKKVLKKKVKKTAAKKAPARKAAVKRPAKAAAVKVKKPTPIKPSAPAIPPGEQPVGSVVHYYSHLTVAVIKLDRGPLQVGDVIHIKGHTTDFRQVIESMQIEHESLTKAVPGDDFGLKVKDHAREHDVVYKVLNP